MGSQHMFVVLGMHRSGTSAITRGLECLGIELGSDLYSGHSEINPKGFFEDAAINSFNEQLLGNLGANWHDTGISLEILDSERIEAQLTAACTLLQQKLQGVEVLALKDPRFCILLPFWQEVFRRLGLDVSYVMAVREPGAVALSLLQRDGFAVEKGLWLWMKHTWLAFKGTVGKRRIVVAYDDMLERPREVLEGVARGLKLDLPSDFDARVAEYGGEFLEKGLRHHQGMGEMPAIVRDLWNWVSGKRGQAGVVDEAWVQLEKRFEALEDVFAMQVPEGALRQAWSLVERLDPGAPGGVLAQEGVSGRGEFNDKFQQLFSEVLELGAQLEVPVAVKLPQGSDSRIEAATKALHLLKHAARARVSAGKALEVRQGQLRSCVEELVAHAGKVQQSYKLSEGQLQTYREQRKSLEMVHSFHTNTFSLVASRLAALSDGNTQIQQRSLLLLQNMFEVLEGARAKVYQLEQQKVELQQQRMAVELDKARLEMQLVAAGEKQVASELLGRHHTQLLADVSRLGLALNEMGSRQLKIEQEHQKQLEQLVLQKDIIASEYQQSKKQLDTMLSSRWWKLRKKLSWLKAC